jgi:hypothetical protein
VEGCAPPAKQQHLWDLVAQTGRVPVKVTGAVKVGMQIVPSGLNDGTAVAWTGCGQPLKIIGRAQEAAVAGRVHGCGRCACWRPQQHQEHEMCELGHGGGDVLTENLTDSLLTTNHGSTSTKHGYCSRCRQVRGALSSPSL